MGISGNAETDELVKRLDTLYSAVITDILDDFDLWNQVMDKSIRPIYPGARVIGRAVTFIAHEVTEVPEKPFAKLIELIDSLEPGNVVVGTVNERQASAMWGDLCATAASVRGAKGLIVEGALRDVDRIHSIPFPVFSTGITPADSKGRSDITDLNIPVKCGGVNVFPGDLIIADSDGITVIPQDKAEEVIGHAEEKCSGENTVRSELEAGRKLKDVFEEFKVL